MRTFLALAAAALGLIALGLFPGVGVDLTQAHPGLASATIEAGDTWFCAPNDSACQTTDAGDVDVSVTINVGDAVTWNFVGSIHTSTACSGSDFATCGAAQGWDSGFKAVGESFSHTFSQAGTFYYKCAVHPTEMRGQITVAAAQQPTATATTPAGTTPASTTPARTATVAAQPAGGGPPSSATDASAPWWLLIVAGGLLLTAAGAFSLRSHRP